MPANGPLGKSVARVALFAAAMLVAVGPSFADEPARKVYSKSLEHQQLAGKDLSGADLRGADLTMTHLEGANLQKADFTGAKLDRTELPDANLSEAIGLGTVDFGMGINAQRANFQQADLAGARVTGMYFEGADFRGANLREAILGGRFHETKFDDADVQGAVFLGALGMESRHDELRARGAIVDADGFVQAVRSGRDFTDCPLDGFQLPNAELDEAQFSQADLHSAKLPGASLRRAKLAGAILCFAQLQGADLSEADLAGTRFVGADLTQAHLTNAKGQGADFSGTCLRDVNFQGADLTNADFRGADLTGANFEGAVLDGAQWESAIIKDLQGVTATEQSAMKGKAARWKHDLWEAYSHFVHNYSVLTWLLSWIAGTAVFLGTWQRAEGQFSLRLIGTMHLVAALPAFAFLFLIMSGTSPTAQFNGSFGGWSAWVKLWPVFYSLAGLALVGFIPVASVALALCFRASARSSLGYVAAVTVLTGLALFGSVGTLLILAPTA